MPLRGQRGLVATGFSHGLEASPAWDSPPCLVLEDGVKANRVEKGVVFLLSEVTAFEISAGVQGKEMCQLWLVQGHAVQDKGMLSSGCSSLGCRSL